MQVCKIDRLYGHVVDHLTVEEAARRISQRRDSAGKQYTSYEEALAALSSGSEVETYAYRYVPTN